MGVKDVAKSVGKAAARQTAGRVALERYKHHEARVSVYRSALKKTYKAVETAFLKAEAKFTADDYAGSRAELNKCSDKEKDLIVQFMKLKEHKADMNKYEKVLRKLDINPKDKTKGSAVNF